MSHLSDKLLRRRRRRAGDRVVQPRLCFTVLLADFKKCVFTCVFSLPLSITYSQTATLYKINLLLSEAVSAERERERGETGERERGASEEKETE